MAQAHAPDQDSYYIPDHSPWPILGSVSLFTIMLGAFQASPALAVIAGVGVVLACWYMLRLHQGLMHDPLPDSLGRVRDIGVGERLVLLPLAGLMLLIGAYPRPLGDIAKGSASQYVLRASVTEPPTASVP